MPGHAQQPHQEKGEVPSSRQGGKPSKWRGGKKSNGEGDLPIDKRLPRLFPHVYRLVAQVPKGKVVTYGQVAALAGAPRAARAIGMALRYLPHSLLRTVPWQRVINASGGISIRGDVFRVEEQRWLLEHEGIAFDRQGKVDLKKYRWAGPGRRKKNEGVRGDEDRRKRG